LWLAQLQKALPTVSMYQPQHIGGKGKGFVYQKNGWISRVFLSPNIPKESNA
jgi:hypothetical protein